MKACQVHSIPYFADPTIYFSFIRDADGAILLDSGRPTSQKGRYDIMSAWPSQKLEPTPVDTLETFADRVRSALSSLGEANITPNLPFAGGLIGYLSYDLSQRESLSRTPPVDDLKLPHASLGLYTWALISDHIVERAYLIFHPHTELAESLRIIELFKCHSSRNPTSKEFRIRQRFSPDISYSRYQLAFNKIKQYILAGDCYQVNLTQRFQTEYTGDTWKAYQTLRNKCPTPFSAFIRLGENESIISFSPERFIECRDRRIETRPIKGTIPRGTTPEEDRHNINILSTSLKDRSENLMIVDLLRNDLGRNCKYGSISVPELFKIESYPNVHHMVSAVRGVLDDHKDTLDLLLGAFPGGSITGAPKLRAMEIIDELEPSQRAIYCGSILYLDARGEMDSSITIRTLLAKDGKMSCWGGGGIVTDSTCNSEYNESITKINNLLGCLESYFMN